MFDPQLISSSFIEIMDLGKTIKQTENTIGTAFAIPFILPNYTENDYQQYFEIYVQKTGGILIGVCSEQDLKQNFMQKDQYFELGGTPKSWAMDSYTGSIGTNSQWKKYGEKIKKKDVIGVWINRKEGKISYTKNGEELGVAFTDIPSNMILYPTVSLKYKNTCISANFGNDYCVCGCGNFGFHYEVVDNKKIYPLNFFDREKEERIAQEIRKENNKNSDFYKLGKLIHNKVACNLEEELDVMHFMNTCHPFSESVNKNDYFWNNFFFSKFGYNIYTEDIKKYGAKYGYIARRNYQKSRLELVKKEKRGESIADINLVYSHPKNNLVYSCGSQIYNVEIVGNGKGTVENYMINAAHDGPITTTASDSRFIISGSCDLFMKVWNFSTGKLIHKFSKIHNFEPTRIIMGDTKCVTSSHDNAISITNFQSFCVEEKIDNAHSDSVSCVCFWNGYNGSKDENIFFSGSWDKTVKLWDRRKPVHNRGFAHKMGYNSIIRSLAVEGNNLVVGNNDGYINVCDIRKFEEGKFSVSPVATLNQKKGSVTTVDLYNNRLMTSGSTSHVYCWKNWDDPDPIRQNKSVSHTFHSNGITKMVSDECLLVSCSEKRLKISSFIELEYSTSHKKAKLESRMNAMKRKMNKDKKNYNK